MAKRSDNSSWKLYIRGIRLLSSYIPHLFLLIILDSVCVTLLPLSSLWFLSHILTALETETTDNVLITWVIAAVVTQAVLALISGIVRRMKEARWEHVYRGVERIVTDKLLSMDHAQLTDPHTRELLTDVRETMHALGRGPVQIPGIVQNLLYGLVGVVCTAGIAVPCFMHPVTASASVRLLWAAGILALLTAVAFAAHRLSVSAVQLESKDTDEVVSLDRMYYTLSGTVFEADKAADLRLYRLDKRLLHYLDKAHRAFFGAHGIKHRKHSGQAAVRHALSKAVWAVWLGVSYAFAVTCSINGALTLGQALLYATAFTMLGTHITALLQAIEQGRQNLVHLKTAFAFLDIPHQLYQGSLTTEKRSDTDYELTFRGVSFRYPGQREFALKGIDLTFTKGSRIALVGENGSGKSTFVKLLCRLYDPDEGEILLNGIDIRKYRYEEYIALIAAVFQDARLLKAPLAHNVAGGTTYDSKRVLQVLSDAQIDNCDDEDLQTFVNTDDSAAIQKLAIARALYKNAPFIVLDEPTAYLDPIAEAKIYEHLDRLIGERTAIFISHRLSSCRFCKEILVLKDGCIVERGTHEQLLNTKNSTYSALWNAQAQYYK